MLKIHANGWGPGGAYDSYEEYWEMQVIVPLIIQYKELTGELIDFPVEDSKIMELVTKFNKEMEKVGDFGTGS